MRKILWLCNVEFNNNPIKTTASWLQPLAEKIQESGKFQLYNITSGKVSAVKETECCKMKQWILPIDKNAKMEMIASISTCRAVAKIIDFVKPDLVHVWGTESIWASIQIQGYIKYTSLLDIQGILSVYTHYYYGGLTNKEILKAIHFKELLMPWRNLYNKKYIFKKRGLIEINCLKHFNFIAYQSEWVKRNIMQINPQAKFYPTKIMLRDNFYTNNVWFFKENNSNPIIFSSSSGAITYKGLHVLIKAIAILKPKYPSIQLRLAGEMKIGNLLLDGYSIFLKKLIKQYNLTENVVYTGPLNDNEIIQELVGCDVCVVPSFIETYCLAFAEAMIIGAPVVVSYTGAMPEFAEHKKEALFYNSLDHVDCAANIELLLINKEIAETISNNARERRNEENDRNKVLETQLNIYDQIINNL